MAPSNPHILPVIVGANQRAMAIVAELPVRGFDIHGVRPPTVPEGAARLRVALPLHSDEATVSALGIAYWKPV